MSFESSGTIVERELLGRIKQASDSPHYIDRHKAFARIRRLQPEGSDPHDPKTDFAAVVMTEIEKLLGVPGQDRVQFYTAVGSTLDRHQGIDGWFEYNGDVVTIDITLNPHKGPEKKADIVFLVPKDGLDCSVDQRQFEKYTRGLAQMVADRFLHATTRTAYNN